MNSRKKYFQVSGVAFFLLVVFGYQNCGKKFGAQDMKSSESTNTESANTSHPLRAVASEKNSRYIVVLKQDSKISGLSTKEKKPLVQARLQALSRDQKLPEPQHTYTHTIQGATYDLTTSQAEILKSNPDVAYVEADQVVTINDIQHNPPWNLDRIDQHAVAPNSSYIYENSGVPVDVYVIDTGILTTHSEFEGRASHGHDFVDNDDDITDCQGHGTHVSGIIGGKTYGVFKKTHLIGVSRTDGREDVKDFFVQSLQRRIRADLAQTTRWSEIYS